MGLLVWTTSGALFSGMTAPEPEPAPHQSIGIADPLGVLALRWLCVAGAVACATLGMLSAGRPAQAGALAALGVLWVIIVRNVRP